MILGVHMTLMIGPTIAAPAPLAITEALTSVEVTQTDVGRSGFQLTLQVGRSGPWDLPDYRLLTHPLLRPFNRVVVMIRFNLVPTVLVDGFITQFDLAPSEQPGGSTLVVRGEDVTVMMGLEQIAFQYPMPEIAQVAAILAKYEVLGWTGAVVDTPTTPDAFIPTRETPTQNATDYDYMQEIASRHGFVFYVRPGPLPNTNVPYWGSSVPAAAMVASELNPALSVGMGAQTNVESISFSYDALAPEGVVGEVVEPNSNVSIPVIFPPLGTDAPMALVPAAINQLMKTRISRPAASDGMDRKVRLEEAREDARTAFGEAVAQAYERARARVNDSVRNAVTASGELDALRYGAVLQAGSVIALRGAGFTNDGKYFVTSVTHSISKGEYKQRFSLRREGVGSIVSLVRP